MRVKPWVTFKTDLPDDQVDDGQEISIYGGRNVAVAIGEIFIKLGCKVEEPYSVEEQGWEFLLSYRGRNNFSCRVCSFHPEFRLLLEELSLLPTFARNKTAYAELALSLADALEEDPRFRGIAWRTLAEGPPEPSGVAGALLAERQGDVETYGPIASGKVSYPVWRRLVLMLAAWTLLSSAVALKTWISHPDSWGSVGGALTIILGNLGVGVLALWVGIRRRREK